MLTKVDAKTLKVIWKRELCRKTIMHSVPNYAQNFTFA